MLYNYSIEYTRYALVHVLTQFFADFSAIESEVGVPRPVATQGLRFSLLIRIGTIFPDRITSLKGGGVSRIESCSLGWNSSWEPLFRDIDKSGARACHAVLAG